jgi:hypothetical protein
VAHIGLVVADLGPVMNAMAAAGHRWSSVAQPVAVLLLADGTIERTPVRYVTTAGGEPRVKIIEGRAGTYFQPSGDASAIHHLTYWVPELDGPTARLVQSGFVVEATGLEPDEATPRYRYLIAPGRLRIELGLSANRAEFDTWAG